MSNEKSLADRLKLCLVCGEGETPESLTRKTELALTGGVTAVQLRVKSWDSREIFDAACLLRDICRLYRALFTVNDRLDIALACGADGVHLGRRDLPVADARRLAPRGFIIGATANTPAEVLAAKESGADYIGCGAAFSTTTKHDVNVIGPEGIKAAVSAARIPCVAIGGITPGNLRLLSSCRCSGISTSSAIMGCANPKERARELAEETGRIFR